MNQIFSMAHIILQILKSEYFAAKLTNDLNQVGIHVVFITTQDTLGRWLRFGLGPGLRSVSDAHKQQIKDHPEMVPWFNKHRTDCWGQSFPGPGQSKSSLQIIGRLHDCHAFCPSYIL